MSEPAAPSAHELAERIDQVRRRIAAAGGEGRVQLLPITKGFGPGAVALAVEAGFEEVGESYAQELLGKAPSLAGPVRWHFVGRLQRNKVRALAPLVAVWQSVDRAALVDEIARRAPGARVLLQVAATSEPQKGGCPPADVPGLLALARAAGLDVGGLMAVGPAGPPEGARRAFRMVSTLADELGLVERSMGMTGDLEVAVEEGSTMVRIGTALFGPRGPRP